VLAKAAAAAASSPPDLFVRQRTVRPGAWAYHLAMPGSDYTPLAIDFLERAWWYWQEIAEECAAANDIVGATKALAHLTECQVSIDLLRRRERSEALSDPARFPRLTSALGS
jgi:hypothetical protein